jgi:hypothetical protein
MPPPPSVRTPFVAEVAISRWFALGAVCSCPPSLLDLGPDVPTTKARYRAMRQQTPHISPISATRPAQKAVSPQRSGGVILNAMIPHHEPFLSPLTTWPLAMTASLPRNGSSHDHV